MSELFPPFDNIQQLFPMHFMGVAQLFAFVALEETIVYNEAPVYSIISSNSNKGMQVSRGNHNNQIIIKRRLLEKKSSAARQKALSTSILYIQLDPFALKLTKWTLSQ